MAHVPQENSTILSELTPVDMSNWSLNSDTCIDAYIDMGLLSGHLMRNISFLTHHTSPHPPPYPSLTHRLHCSPGNNDRSRLLHNAAEVYRGIEEEKSQTGHK